MIEFFTTLPIGRLKDYAFNSLRHLTVKKAVNIFKTELNLFFRKTQLNSYPYLLTVDTISTCQLRCPLCSTGQRKNLRKDGIMDFNIYKKIIDEIGEYLLDVHLLWWGEPFLNKDILNFVSYAHKKNIGTFISTNFSHDFNQNKMEEIVKSGLDTLNVSLDGITADAYSKYRVGGNFDQVVKNIKLLVKTRRRLKSKFPRIEWQFLVNKYNEDQVGKLERFKEELGVDSLVLEQLLVLFGQSKRSDVNINDWLPKDEKFRPKDYSLKNNKSDNMLSNKCWWLYRGAAISHDGGISPCCYNNSKLGDFGNLNDVGFKIIWNNENYVFARSLFSKEKNIMVKNKPKIICQNCSLLLKR